MTKCPQCGTEISEDAAACPKCGAPGPNNLKLKIKKYGPWLFWGFIGLAIIGSLVSEKETGQQSTSQGPKCELGEPRSEVATFIINGEPDFGVRSRVTVKNLGSDQEFKLMGRLATSEGTFRREQVVHFSKGETRDIVFQFHEPTINVDAKSVQFFVECSLGR